MARVLSDGGFLGMVCYSPCFRCCSVLNYATHYTTKFGRCPILNKIYREDTKSTKGARRIMNVELRNIEYRRVVAGLRPAFYLMGGPSTGSGWLKSQWFLVDKLVAGGLDDWEVKIADFVPSTAKPTSLPACAAIRLGTREASTRHATRQVFCWGKMRKRVP